MSFLGGWSQNPCLLQGKIPSTKTNKQKNKQKNKKNKQNKTKQQTNKQTNSGGSNPRHCIKQDSEPNTVPTNCSGPTWCSEVGHVASRTDTTEGHALWQPGGAKKDSRFCDGDRHLRLVKRRQRRRTVIKNIKNSLYCELRLHLISPPTLQTAARPAISNRWTHFY